MNLGFVNTRAVISENFFTVGEDVGIGIRTSAVCGGFVAVGGGIVAHFFCKKIDFFRPPLFLRVVFLGCVCVIFV